MYKARYVFVAAMLFFFGTVEVWGCLCKPLSTKNHVRFAINKSKIILIGEVTNINREFIARKLVTTVTLNVKEKWLSDTSKQVHIITRSNCEVQFLQGKSYLVYAYENQSKQLETDVCMRTRILDKATEDLNLFKVFKPKKIS